MSKKKIPYVLATDATDQAMVTMLNRNMTYQQINERRTREALQERTSNSKQGTLKETLGKVRAYVSVRIRRLF